MNDTRQSHLDALRGLAASLVVFSHYIAAFYPYALFGEQESYRQQAPWESLFFYPPFGLLTAGHFAVCLFFILSGYVLSYGFMGERGQGHKIIAAIVKRPVRLGGLVLFTILLAALLWHFGLFYNKGVADLSGSKPFFIGYWVGPIDWSRVFSDVTTAAFSQGRLYNPPLWTIKMELYGSLMVFLFVLLFGAAKYRMALLVLLLLLSKNSLYQGFVLGMIFADLVKHKSPLLEYISGRRAWLFVLALFLFFAAYPNNAKHEFLQGSVYGYLPSDAGLGGGYSMLAALLLFLAVTTSSRLKSLLHHRYLQFLGHVSYGLYVIHFLVIGSFSSWLFLLLHEHLGYGNAFLVALLTGIPLIILGAYLLTRYIDDPAIKAASAIGRLSQRITRSGVVTRAVTQLQGLMGRGAC